MPTTAVALQVADAFPEAVFVNYEMINPDDPFGQVSHSQDLHNGPTTY